MSSHWTESVERMLKEYESQIKLFDAFADTCKGLIEHLLRDKNIEVHAVTCRVKKRKSLADKLKAGDYENLSQITDIVGIRVITHFENEINEIGSLVREEFVIDRENSVDKREKLEPDRFGYISLHYICSLTRSRVELREYRSFQSLKCEIQIRSILQHAWAEIEHDLGYKSEYEVPGPIRRRFSRLAGLLEVADQEFDSIRRELQEYESQVPMQVTTAPAKVGIDRISLKAIFDQDVLRTIDNQLANGINAPIKEDNDNLLSALSRGLPFVNINTVDELVKEIEKHRELLVFQATRRLKGKRVENVHRGMSALQLLWVLMGLQGGEEKILRGLATIGYHPSREFAQEIMHQIQKFESSKPPDPPKLHGQSTSA